MSHDQNFKNLILEYPQQALAFLAGDEAEGLEGGARVTPLRQEQLQQRLGERFRELDVALQVEWPNGEPAATAVSGLPRQRQSGGAAEPAEHGVVDAR